MARHQPTSSIGSTSPFGGLRWIIRHRILALALVGALTLFFLSTIPRLTFNTSVYDMIIADLDETRQYRQFIDVFGSDEIIRVVITCGDVFDALARYTERDFFRLPPITFIVVALILFLRFRTIRDVMLPMACVTLSLVWTLGLIAISGLALSILTMIVPVFLIAVGTAYCLHIVSEYRVQAACHASAEAATLAAFENILLPTLLAAVTTMLGLASLFVSRIQAIDTFAPSSPAAAS